MIGCCGYCNPAGDQKFLIPAIHQRRNFPTDQAARPGYIRGTAGFRAGQHRAAAIFADFNLICDPGRLPNIK